MCWNYRNKNRYLLSSISASMMSADDAAETVGDFFWPKHFLTRSCRSISYFIHSAVQSEQLSLFQVCLREVLSKIYLALCSYLRPFHHFRVLWESIVEVSVGIFKWHIYESKRIRFYDSSLSEMASLANSISKKNILLDKRLLDV